MNQNLITLLSILAPQLDIVRISQVVTVVQSIDAILTQLKVAGSELIQSKFNIKKILEAVEAGGAGALTSILNTLISDLETGVIGSGAQTAELINQLKSLRDINVSTIGSMKLA